MGDTKELHLAHHSEQYFGKYIPKGDQIQAGARIQGKWPTFCTTSHPQENLFSICTMNPLDMEYRCPEVTPEQKILQDEFATLTDCDSFP